MAHDAPPLPRAQSVIAFDIGPRFGGQREGLREFHCWRCQGFGVDQAMQQVDDVGLGRHAGFQGQFDGREHSLLVMLEHQGQDLDHLAIATWRLEQVLLQGA